MLSPLAVSQVTSHSSGPVTLGEQGHLPPWKPVASAKPHTISFQRTLNVAFAYLLQHQMPLSLGICLPCEEPLSHHTESMGLSVEVADLSLPPHACGCSQCLFNRSSPPCLVKTVEGRAGKVMVPYVFITPPFRRSEIQAFSGCLDEST